QPARALLHHRPLGDRRARQPCQVGGQTKFASLGTGDVVACGGQYAARFDTNYRGVASWICVAAMALGAGVLAVRAVMPFGLTKEIHNSRGCRAAPQSNSTSLRNGDCSV